MEVQAEEGGDDAAVPTKARSDDTSDGRLHIGAVAFPTVEPNLQRPVAGDEGNAQQSKEEHGGTEDHSHLVLGDGGGW